MKRDTEWLKSLINEEGIVMDMNLLGRHDEQYWKNENIKINKGRLFYLIDKLDKPEVLSSDWISKNVEYAYFDMLDGSGRLSSATAIIKPEKLKKLLVPKRELPVIPNYVAKWISERHEIFELHYALKTLGNNEQNWEDVHEWYRKNTRKFVNAYLDGYEVEEEEQKYVVKIPTNENNDIPYAIVADSGDIWTDALPSKYKLTEEEIRRLTKGDVLFEHFAVKVEEMEAH